mmetsp:Transcript_9364/g.25339  ORF Transcript_9364/g.25339 Transcript_9364/m.25339 type:complete len:229 (+) Transcript_9364:2226-2912(+)
MSRLIIRELYLLAIEGVRVDFVHLDGDERTLERVTVPIEEADLVVAGAAHRLRRVTHVGPLDQHLQLTVGKPLGPQLSNLVHHHIQSVQAICLDQIRHLILPNRGRGPRTRGVRRRVDPVKTHVPDELHRPLKLLLRLPREPHNHVAADARIRNVPANAIDDLLVPSRRVPPSHLSQNIIVAALERDVEELAHLWQLCARPNQPLCKVPRVTRREPNPLYSGHVVDVV